MIPTGYRFLINWGCTLLWLGFWPPVYAVLNLIMNIAARSSTVAEIGTSGGITIANVTGIAAANAEIKVMAGYLALSVPFICIALVNGVCSFIHLASQMTGTTTSSASNAVNEVVNGNLSYGNVNLGNSQMGNVSQLQRNMNSLIGSGGHRLDTGGVQITNEALTDLLELHFIELGKMKEMREDSPITFWIEFFKDPYSEKVKKLCEYVPEIKEAKEVYERAKSDPEAQELIRLREKGLRDYISGLENAHEEGIESERKKNALNMKARGLENSFIADCLNISESDLEKLLNG